MFQLAEIHVSLPAERITSLGIFPISNSTILGLVGLAIVLSILFYARGKIMKNVYNRLSVGVLWLFEVLLGTIEEALGSREKAIKLAPLAITIFLFVLVNNWLEVLPIVGPITWHGMPLFRGLAADLNFTAALAIITMTTAQIWAIRVHGFRGNLGRYIGNPFKDPMHFFEGLLELVAEFSRLIALAMRLFGNIFGGEVLLAVMGFITVWASPVTLPPFMILELFVGVVQAYVFFMLTVVFVSLGATAHDSSSDSPDTHVAGAAGS